MDVNRSLQILRRIPRRTIVAVSVAIHLVAVAVLGVAGSIVSTLPIVVTAFLFGPTWGLVAGIVSYPTNVAILWMTAGTPSGFVTAGSMIGTLAAISIGWIVGSTQAGRIMAGRERDNAKSLIASTFQHAPSGIAILSPDGRFEEANPAFCEMLGSTRQSLLAVNWRDISPADEHAETASRIAAVLEGQEDYIELHRIYYTADGSQRLGLVRMSRIQSFRESDYHILAQIVDITEMHRTNLELRRLLEAKNRFLAAISHEIRTPLTAVTGLSMELHGDIDRFEKAEVAEIAEIIAQQSIELGGLVDDYLVHARSDGDEIAVRPEPLDLGTEAERVLDLLDGSAVTDVLLDVGDTPTIAVGDGLRVRQVIRNLIQNARRHGGDRIGIAVTSHGTWSSITVMDDGDGVPEHKAESIFDPFERADSDPSLTESVGIGLHVSRTLARKMGGDVRYRRQAGWTHFVLELPRHAGPATSVATTSLPSGDLEGTVARAG